MVIQPPPSSGLNFRVKLDHEDTKSPRHFMLPPPPAAEGPAVPDVKSVLGVQVIAVALSPARDGRMMNLMSGPRVHPLTSCAMFFGTMRVDLA